MNYCRVSAKAKNNVWSGDKKPNKFDYPFRQLDPAPVGINQIIIVITVKDIHARPLNQCGIYLKPIAENVIQGVIGKSKQ